MASPLTVWSSAADGALSSSNGVYSTARAGSGVGYSLTAASEWVGQWGAYNIQEVSLDFLTSGVGAGNTVTTATLSLYPADFTSRSRSLDLQARLDDWGPTIGSTDWVAGDAFNAATLLAHFTLSGANWNSGHYNVFADDAFPSNVAKTGTTYVVLCDANFAAGTAPPDDYSQRVYLANDATGVGGTDRDPKLYVEYGAPPVAPTVTIMAISDITGNSAASGGWITDPGSAEVTDRGVCWNTTGTPTIADSHTHD